MQSYSDAYQSHLVVVLKHVLGRRMAQIGENPENLFFQNICFPPWPKRSIALLLHPVIYVSGPRTLVKSQVWGLRIQEAALGHRSGDSVVKGVLGREVRGSKAPFTHPALLPLAGLLRYGVCLFPSWVWRSMILPPLRLIRKEIHPLVLAFWDFFLKTAVTRASAGTSTLQAGLDTSPP